MMIARRNLLTLAAKSAALIPIAVFAAGCPIASVLAALERYVPLGLQAFAGIVTLINPAAGSALATAVLIAKSLWTDVNAAIASYNAADPAAKTTLLGKVDTALSSLVGGLQRILNSLGLQSQTDQQTAVAALMLLIATLTGIQETLPVPSAAQAHTARTAAMPRQLMVGAQQVEIVGDIKQFKAQYNTIMRAGGHTELQLAGK